jgi:shikimate dehydrogenase
MRRFGLIGYPLSHSFSQSYFSEKFKRENISDAIYENFPINSISELETVLKNNPDLIGLNVTIPYKLSVIEHLDKSSTKLPVNACNCIRINAGRLTGYNTDIFGFEQSLSTRLRPYHTSALVLGDGGAAKAVKFVLKKLGISFSVVSRKMDEPGVLHDQDLTKERIENTLLIINTTPLGMFPNVDAAPDIPYQYLHERHYLYDLIYNPSETTFLKKGAAQGAVVKNGLEMLILQAEESWRIWNNPV